MVLVEDDGSVVALAGAVGECEVEAAVDMIDASFAKKLWSFLLRYFILFSEVCECLWKEDGEEGVFHVCMCS